MENLCILHVVEKKKNWNLPVYSSLADEIDRMAAERGHGWKGAYVSAMAAMFLAAPPEEQRVFVDLVKRADYPGIEGTLLDAVRSLRRGDGEDGGAAADVKADAPAGLADDAGLAAEDAKRKVRRTIQAQAGARRVSADVGDAGALSFGDGDSGEG